MNKKILVYLLFCSFGVLNIYPSQLREAPQYSWWSQGSEWVCNNSKLLAVGALVSLGALVVRYLSRRRRRSVHTINPSPSATKVLDSTEPISIKWNNTRVKLVQGDITECGVDGYSKCSQ